MLKGSHSRPEPDDKRFALRTRRHKARPQNHQKNYRQIEIQYNLQKKPLRAFEIQSYTWTARTVSVGRLLCLPSLEWRTVKLPVCPGHGFAVCFNRCESKRGANAKYIGETAVFGTKEMNSGVNHVANHAICAMLRFAVVQHSLSFQ